MPEIAGKMGIDPHLLEPYGHDVAKIKLDAIEELRGKPRAKYVVVSAITPTPLGEGKTTTTVGWAMRSDRSGRRRPSPSGSLRWGRRSGSRVAPRAAATARSSRWSD